MYNGLARFEYYFNQLQALLNTASAQKNPALWLYRNNARTPLFMLEGLSKLYADLHNNNRFTKIKEHFKLLEDVLGAIDYYDSMAKELGANKKVPAAAISYLQGESREKIQSLNETLAEKDWFATGETRLAKIHKKLGKADWLKEEREVKALEEFYGKEIYGITEFVQEIDFRFKDLESGVHELRRKLRWLSIYPQALRGSIQLEASKPVAKHLKKYLTTEITTSAFNKMPEPGANQFILVLDQNNFYALSWMIAELGRLKDSGLRVIALGEALQQTQNLNEETALKSAHRLLGKKQPSLGELIGLAENTCRVYFKEHNLEHLVKGVIRKGV